MQDTLRILLGDVLLFSQYLSGIRLRSYQQNVARAIVDSVVHARGLNFVVMFPRQSGKNELQAQIEAYLLTLYSQTPGPAAMPAAISGQAPAEMVKVSPTWKPQSLNAMRRLERTLRRNLLTRDIWQKESGYIYAVGQARITFLSGAPTANIVGATASLLLECDEAQDVQIAKWDKDIAPMAASTNATRVFWGTAWTTTTLLARELRNAERAQERDGVQRVFRIRAQDLAAEVPAYQAFVQEQVARLGATNPLVLSQYFSTEIHPEGGLFPLARRLLMQGEHPPQPAPLPEHTYVFTIDVAGEDEAADLTGAVLTPLSNPAALPADTDHPAGADRPGRDATALTIFDLDLSTIQDALIRRPTYRVAQRLQWVGVRHATLYAQIAALAETWQPRWVVIDATGVGTGLASFLGGPLGRRLLPFTFTQASKSRLGWDFLAIVEAGRYREHRGGKDDWQAEFWRQVECCTFTILDGPQKIMRWEVPAGTRHPLDGKLVHDDLLVSAALIAALEPQVEAQGGWGVGRSGVVGRRDLLETLEEF
jgi:hypothetical protein